MTKKKLFYFHNANDSVEPYVDAYEDANNAPGYMTGPFDSFDEARKDAIATCKSMIETWQYALKNARGIEKPEGWGWE